MSIFKKALALLLVVALTAAIAVNVTLAYLVDEKSDVNVMTLGNVEIVQHEYERANGIAYNATASKEAKTLIPFEQGQPLYPAVPKAGETNPYTAESTELFKWGDYVYTGTAANGLWNDNKISNVMDKFVFVENVGKSEAYVRTLIAFECPEDMAFSEGPDKEFMMNINGSKTSYKWERIGHITVDGVRYLVMEATYLPKLAPGKTGHPSLLQVLMTHNATNEDMELLGDSYEILVLSQAVQAMGFADATTALDTAFGDTSLDLAAKWFKGIGNVQYVDVSGTKVPVEGEAAKEYLEDLKNGQNLMVDKDVDIIAFDTDAVDAQGATVTLAGVGPDAYGYLAFLPDAGKDVTVSNLNVTGSGFVEIGHYGQGGGNYTANNLKIENLASTLKNENKGIYVGCAFMAFGDTILNDCVMTGTTAIQDGTRAVDLGCGQAWKGYTDEDNKVSTTVNRGEYGTIYCWSHALVTINGAKVDTIYVAPIAGLVTLNAGTEVDTIMVDYGNLSLSTYATKANLQKLVIDPDASVNQIIFDGNTYTVSEWNAYLASLT